MRIALVHAHSWPDVRRGGERYLADLAWWLATSGHDVEVVTGTTGPPSTSTTDDGAVVRRCAHVHPGALARRGVSPLDTFGVAAFPTLVRGRYDVAHALTPTAALAARAARIPTVYTIIGHPTPGQFGRRPFDRRLVAAAVRMSSAVTALSEASAARVTDLFGRAPVVLPPGVRTDVFTPELTARTGPVRVLFPADASDPRKGVHFVLAAFARLLDSHRDARLVLAGPGDHEWARHGLGGSADRVMAAVDAVGPGDLADVPGRYRAATVTVLPSLHEAFGLVLAESLASGTPVVGADDAGIPAVVDDDTVGRLVPHGDVAALARALADVAVLATDPATPPRCVASAQRFAWDAGVGARHIALYGEVTR